MMYHVWVGPDLKKETTNRDEALRFARSKVNDASQVTVFEYKNKPYYKTTNGAVIGHWVDGKPAKIK